MMRGWATLAATSRVPATAPSAQARLDVSQDAPAGTPPPNPEKKDLLLLERRLERRSWEKKIPEEKAIG